MEILASLGVDHTFFVQFLIASFAFSVLIWGVFTPYNNALTERESRTIGGEAVADDLLKQTQDLRARFEQRARAISGEIKSIFDAQRSEGQKDYDKISLDARTQAQALVESTRKSVAAQITDAQGKLRSEVPALSQAIVSKLLSKKV